MTYTRTKQDDGSYRYVRTDGIRMADVRKLEWTERGSYGQVAGASYVAELYSCYQDRPNRIKTVSTVNAGNACDVAREWVTA